MDSSIGSRGGRPECIHETTLASCVFRNIGLCDRTYDCRIGLRFLQLPVHLLRQRGSGSRQQDCRQGYHFHFISDDRTGGSHPIRVRVYHAVIRVRVCLHFIRIRV